MFTRQADGMPMTAAEFFEGGNGMSLRDWFAGMALQGLLANPGYRLFQANEQTIGDVAEHAARIANIMITARTKGATQ